MDAHLFLKQYSCFAFPIQYRGLQICPIQNLQVCTYQRKHVRRTSIRKSFQQEVGRYTRHVINVTYSLARRQETTESGMVGWDGEGS